MLPIRMSIRETEQPIRNREFSKFYPRKLSLVGIQGGKYKREDSEEKTVSRVDVDI